ncbi:MAG: alkaline phosphatase family protein [Deltaproteobacteria bacterium]|nr:alkaline phosphatase family protein [Deltaproteobacteria bacterium]
MRPLLVLALDGATFDVIRPLSEAGRLPNLARWIEDGSSAPLRSTTPPVTFPAWSTFMTGLEPGRHGVFDFTEKVPGAYRLRFVNASDRYGSSLFARVCEAGGRVLVLGMPATFPPEPLDGLLVCGFDAPVSAGTEASSASDPELYRDIAAEVGPWMRPDLNEGAREKGFHERAVGVLLDRIARKKRFALEALARLRERWDGERPDLMLVVFSESDTVGHHYWRDHDPGSPRHDPAASAERRGAVAAVYEALDSACGELREAYGEDAMCVVLSDHGMGGASKRVVHLNRYLAQCGLLARVPAGRGVDLLARRARDLALRLLPPRAAQQIFRRARGAAARLESAARFQGFDWRRTLAFSEEANTLPGVWINLAGREARGCVAPGDYEAVRDRVIEALKAWKLPGGAPVVAGALRREEVFEGPFVERAPDVVVELALDEGYGLSLVATPWSAGRGDGQGYAGPPDGGESPGSLRELAGHEFAGGRGVGMNGTHRSHGIFVATGQPFTLADGALPRLVDMAPTLLGSMGIEWSEEQRDGAPLLKPRREYSEEEDALVADRLRALGYLE